MPEKKSPSPFFRKIPKRALLTPAGMICLVLAVTIELFDYLLDTICFFLFKGMAYEVVTGPIKTFIDFFYAVFSALLLGVPILSNLLPFLIERIPVLGTILPAWVLRLFL
jgi:hypothetical protein